MTEIAVDEQGRSYVAGEWYGVIGPAVTVLLPPQEKARVPALWSLVDEGAGFEEVLDALISAGLRALSGFVLLSATEDTTLVVLRGSARATFVAAGERVELAGSTSTTWVERSLQQVTGAVVELHEVSPSARSFAIEQGLVRLGRLTVGSPDVADVGAGGVDHADDPDDAHDAGYAAGSDGRGGPDDHGSRGGSATGGLLDGAPLAVVAAAGGVAAVGTSDDSGESRGSESGTTADDEDEARPAVAGADDLLPLPPQDALSGPWAADDDPQAGTDDGDGGDDDGDDDDDDREADGGAPELGTEPVRPQESLVAFGAVPVPEVDSWIDPGHAAKPLDRPQDGLQGGLEHDSPDQEVTELLAVDGPAAAPVDPDGTEPMEPLGPLQGAAPRTPGDPDDDLMQDFARPGEHDADPLGLGRDDDLGHDALGLVAGEPWSGTPVDPGPVGLHVVAAPDDDADADPADRDAADRELVDGASTDDVAGPPDHDGATRHSPWDESGLSLVRPGIPGQEPAPPVTTRPVARLVISDGRRLDVDRVVVLGRAPSARRFDDDGEPLLVRVESPHQEISATHVEIRPGSGADHGTAVVTDLGSTNGTVVAQPGLEPEELQPGVSVQLIPGAIIDLGDGVTLQVVRP